MNRPEQEFWNSRLAKIIKMIDMYADKKIMQAAAIRNEEYKSKYFSSQTSEVKEIKSLKEIEGWS
jgi:hypothetical protein